MLSSRLHAPLSALKPGGPSINICQYLVSGCAPVSVCVSLLFCFHVRQRSSSVHQRSEENNGLGNTNNAKVRLANLTGRNTASRLPLPFLPIAERGCCSILP